MTDQVTTEVREISYNDFAQWGICGASVVDHNLAPGEAGFAGYAFSIASPLGHSILATIKVCTQDGLAGTCQEKSITFTP